MEDSPSPARTRRLLGVLGGALLVCLALTLLILFFREHLPPLTAEILESNLERWRGQALQDYDLRLHNKIGAGNEEEFEATVRAGKIVKLTLNGHDVLNRNAAWTVNGLFGLMRRELQMAQSSEPEAGQRRDSVLKARFHETLGIPEVFHVFSPRGSSVWITLDELEVPGRGTIFP